MVWEAGCVNLIVSAVVCLLNTSTGFEIPLPWLTGGTENSSVKRKGLDHPSLESLKEFKML